MAFESRDELSLIRALDMAPQVTWFCEQPTAIGYTFAGRHHTYYPDLLAATKDGYCILIEVKPLLDMPLAINQAKAAAARAFCARNGWGFLGPSPKPEPPSYDAASRGSRAAIY